MGGEELRFDCDHKILCQEESGSARVCNNLATHRVAALGGQGALVVCEACSKLYDRCVVTPLEAAMPAQTRNYKSEVEVMGNALDSIWRLMYPLPEKEWEYPGQVAAHIRQYIHELKEKK